MKIAHISDTHLGRRIKNTRNEIINNEIRPLEDDFYNAWHKFVNEVTETKNRPDIIIHSGDFFDTPAGYDRSSPPEYARNVAIETFKQLADAGIPIVIIDGNHGKFMEYRSSTLSEYAIAFNNMHLFTHFDLRDAIRNQKPLYKDFPELNLRVLAHPAIDPRMLTTLNIQKIYDNWIKTQNSSINPKMINVAVAHGMTINSSLHPDLLKANYDYIALGDNHKMDKVTDKAWYSGSTERWRLDEYEQEKGYLLVELEKGKAYPKVTKKLLNSSRKIVSEELEIKHSDNNSVVINKVKDIFERNGLATKYDYRTAARVRIGIKTNTAFGSSFNVSEVDSYLRKMALDSDEFNVAEFYLVRPDHVDYEVEISSPAALANIEYLVENPEKEFKEYVTSTRAEDLKNQNLDANLLAKIFAEALAEER
ncbi:MAG: metallophosphoesterase family protein [Nitrosotalea sp.]